MTGVIFADNWSSTKIRFMASDEYQFRIHRAVRGVAGRRRRPPLGPRPMSLAPKPGLTDWRQRDARLAPPPLLGSGIAKGAPPLAEPHAPKTPWVRVVHVHAPGSIALSIGGRIDRADAAVLGDQVRELLDGHPAQDLICDVGSLDYPDASAVDAICRIKLVASRLGWRLRLQNASPELIELLDLCGLGGVVPAPARLSRRVGGAGRTAGTSGRCRERK
jgi:anti-anti-sigma factor